MVPPEPPGLPAGSSLARRIRAFLEESGGPVPSRELARRFLRMESAGEPLLVSLLRPLLQPAGIRYEPGSGWSAPAGERAAAKGAAGADSVPGRGSGAPPQGPLLADAARPAVNRPVEGPPAGEPSGERSRGPARVACAVELGRRGVRRVCLVDPACPPAAPGSPPAGRVDGLDWGAVSALLAGAEAVVLHPRAESGPLRLALAARGLPGPERIRGLAAVAREAVRIPRGARPEEIASALGTPWVEGDDAATAAENVAACLAAISSRGEGGSAGPGREPPRFLTAGFLRSVPAAPGTYRFVSAGGETLYVGKAADLRRRLSSYAAEAAGSGRRRRVLDLLDGVDRVEIRETGSDLQALLEEASEIARRRPRANVQLEIRERRRRYAPGGRRALLLPAAGRGAVSVIFLREGSFHGICRLGPRGGGRRRALELLRGLLSPAGSGPSREARAGAISRSTQLVNSWLARHGEIAQLDVDACRGAADALRRLLAAAEDLRRGETGPTLHR